MLAPMRAAESRRDEIVAALISFAYFFCLLSSYYVVRPVRDEMATRGGVGELPALFSATFLATLVAVPIYGWVVARFPRAQSVPIVYRFFLLHMIVFAALLHYELAVGNAARVFFVWLSVFNLFVVSVFWSVMADVFSNAQGKRLFGFIAAGGSAGGLCGPLLTAAIATRVGPEILLILAAALLELAARCAGWLEGRAPRSTPAAALGGSPVAGVSRLLRSRYFLAVAGYVTLFSVAGTFLYFTQQGLVGGSSLTSAERTRLFALIDLSVNGLTIALQVLVAGWLMRRVGVAAVLALLPLAAAGGFAALIAAPSLAVVISAQSVFRAIGHALARPAREVLFTVVDREDKYKAKSVIDTLVFRGGDAASGWAFAGLGALGMGLSAISAVALPLAAGWLGLAVWLGRRHDDLAARRYAR